MAYQALYRAWRPLTFDTVVGQEAVTRTLKNEIRSGRIGHAYLFCGSRGTGKTSTARIFSRAVNCTDPKDGNPCNECDTCKGILDGSILDIVEIDAASNNGVDNIRDIRTEANYHAALTKYKIYIIDEVHMLSTGAFNALLKLLEEPPEHVIFILATTESQKVPKTISSRCQQFDFKRIREVDIYRRLIEVCEGSGLSADERALRLIAAQADGALRDALSLLEQCISVGENRLTYEDTAEFLGVTDVRFTGGVLRAVANRDVGEALRWVDEYVKEGKNPTVFTDSLVDAMRNLLLCKVLPSPEQQIHQSEERIDEWTELANAFSREAIVHHITRLTDAAHAAKYVSDTRTLLEIAVVKMCMPEYSMDMEGLIARIGELERKIANGVTVQPTTQVTVPSKPETSSDAVPETEQKPPKESPIPEDKPAPKEEPSGTVGTIRSKWGEVMAEVNRSGKMMLILGLQGAAISQEGEKVTLVLSNEANRDMVKQEKSALDSIVSSVTGTDISLALRLAGEQTKTEQNEAGADHLQELIAHGDVDIIE